VNLRFYQDPATQQPHILEHGVAEHEVGEVLDAPLEDRGGTEGSRVAIGQTNSGRFLKVIYVPGPGTGEAFVITAFDLGPRALKALRRRLRRRS
jgi:hypothetical protein